VSKKQAKAIWPPPLPKRPHPALATPKAEHLARLRSFAPVPENIYLKRLAQLQAFNARNQAKALRRSRSQAIMFDRAVTVAIGPRSLNNVS
jgi:hypothetical protein